jgi:hypothetical protein
MVQQDAVEDKPAQNESLYRPVQRNIGQFQIDHYGNLQHWDPYAHTMNYTGRPWYMNGIIHYTDGRHVRALRH